MPRHRKERVPRHRAQRQADQAARRVRVNAAVATARTALATLQPDDPDDADATLPLEAVPAAATRSGGLLGRSRVRPHGRSTGSRPGRSGARRGLLVTPWFAAGTGFVLAASMWIYSPHAELRFPSSAINELPCQQQGCSGGTDQGAGSLTTTSGQPIPHAKKQAHTRHRSAAAGLTFTYTVLWQQQGKFEVMISVTGKRSLRGWQLAFALPGDQVSNVIGASFQPSGSDGGTASALAGSDAGPWSDGGNGGSGSQAAADDHNVVRFMVFGDGTPVLPTGCRYKGASCTFQLASQG